MSLDDKIDRADRQRRFQRRVFVRALVRAAFFAASERSRGPFVRTAFFAERERSAAVRWRATACA
jgi:hypothetical protein